MFGIAAAPTFPSADCMTLFSSSVTLPWLYASTMMPFSLPTVSLKVLTSALKLSNNVPL